MPYSLMQVRNRLPEACGFPADFDSWMNQFFTNGSDETGAVFHAHTDLSETDAGYEVSMDLPGLSADDVNIEIEDGKLTISGERTAETKEEGKTYHRVERRHGSFKRMVNLPKAVDAENIKVSNQQVRRLELVRADVLWIT